jgi:hypothetical protein
MPTQSIEIAACLTLRVNAYTDARRRRFIVGRVLVINTPPSCVEGVLGTRGGGSDGGGGGGGGGLLGRGFGRGFAEQEGH